MLSESDLHRLDEFLDWVCSDAIESNSLKRPSVHVDGTAPETGSRASKRQKIVSPQLFMTNIPFSATQQSLRKFLQDRSVDFESLHLGCDSLGKFQGWCLVNLAASADSAILAPLIDGALMDDRVIYCCVGGETQRVNFRLPEDLIERLRKIKDERNLSGSPAGKIADGYRKMYGEKFPAERFGFRTFVHALGSIEGVSLSVDSQTNQTICTWL